MNDLFSKIDSHIDRSEPSMKQDLQTLLQFKSVFQEDASPFPFGNEIGECLRETLRLCEGHGLRVVNHDDYMGYGECGSGSQLNGILVHLDVVPEGDPEKWSLPPFQGVEKDGNLYGRGALDDKGPAIAVIYALRTLMDVGFDFKNRWRILFGTDEETSSRCIAHYIQTGGEIPTLGFTPDADFPVIHGEMGVIFNKLTKSFKPFDGCGSKITEVKGGTCFNMVPDLATASIQLSQHGKCRIKNLEQIKHAAEEFNHRFDFPFIKVMDENPVRVTCDGISAHGSTPDLGKNAISYLMTFLGELLGPECIGCSGVHKSILEYNRSIGLQNHGEKCDLNLKDDLSGSLVFNLGVIQVDEYGYSADLNIRYPIRISFDTVMSNLTHHFGRDGYEIQVEEHLQPVLFEKNDPLITTLLDSYNTYHQTQLGPITIGGGTYARSLPNIVAFGPLHPDQTDVMHQKDEFISITQLKDLTKLYARAIVNLDSL